MIYIYIPSPDTREYTARIPCTESIHHPLHPYIITSARASLYIAINIDYILEL
jgi:hypothetical protein